MANQIDNITSKKRELANKTIELSILENQVEILKKSIIDCKSEIYDLENQNKTTDSEEKLLALLSYLGATEDTLIDYAEEYETLAERLRAYDKGNYFKNH